MSFIEETGIPVSPINQRPIPIGTIAEAEEMNLSPAVFSTCARPNAATGVLGCAWFDKCRVSAKGKDGPKNYGCHYFKGKAQGGARTTNVYDCMWIASHIHDIERNGGALRVVAEEGETIERVTGVSINNATGQVETNPYAVGTHRDDMRITEVVKPFPRPKDNPELIQAVLSAEVVAQEMERRSDESLAVATGNFHAIAPVDKREGRKPRK
ncbi:MAG: hypothetical protein IPM06_20160 [Rhizobiales bacterium]|nr:hypothetical protein [Hyphomicrobiales bacterium]